MIRTLSRSFASSSSFFSSSPLTRIIIPSYSNYHRCLSTSSSSSESSSPSSSSSSSSPTPSSSSSSPSPSSPFRIRYSYDEISAVQKAAEKGDPIAQYRVAHWIINNVYSINAPSSSSSSSSSSLVPPSSSSVTPAARQRNLHLAGKYLFNAAGRGYKPAVAFFHSSYGPKSLTNIFGVARDRQQAIPLLQSNWEKQTETSPEVAAELGLLYQDAAEEIEDNKDNTIDPKEKQSSIGKNSYLSYTFFEQSARLGYAVAQHSLGIILLNGVNTAALPPNPIEAFRFFQLSADQGHTNALFDVGSCYTSGLGTTKDEIKGLELQRQAAKAGHTQSMMALAIQLAEKESDQKEASHWLMEATKADTEIAAFLRAVAESEENDEDKFEQKVKKLFERRKRPSPFDGMDKQTKENIVKKD